MLAPGRSTREGSALIMVLGVILILSLLVVSLRVQVEFEIKISGIARSRNRAEALALSGMAIAEMLLNKRNNIDTGLSVSEKAEDRWFSPAEKLKNGSPVLGLREELGSGTVILDIVPEPALLNVNKLLMDDWERVLEVGGIPEVAWPELIDSFMDWVDVDNNPRMEGGETEDYYADQETPYAAKNGSLDSIGELLLVKGFTKAVLYGGPMFLDENETDEPIVVSGIADMLTTYGDGKINVNAASQRVLMTLPDVDNVIAGAIIEEREGWVNPEGGDDDNSFRDVNDFMGRVIDLSPMVKSKVTTQSRFFRITSVGQVGRVTRRIWAIVSLSGKEMTILRWREES